MTIIDHRSAPAEVERAWASHQCQLVWAVGGRKKLGASGVRQGRYTKCSSPWAMRNLYAQLKVILSMTYIAVLQM